MSSLDAASTPPDAAGLFDEVAEHGPSDQRKRWGLAWLIHYVREIGRRRRFMKRYSWAVPTPTAIGQVGDFVGDRHLLEIGAGNGLWAHLLSAYGVSVTATDDYSWAAPPPGVKTRVPSGFPVEPGRIFPVEQVDALAAVKKYADHQALLLCWPPYDKPMAFRALTAFQGDGVVYVGDAGCSADESFHDELKRHWQLHDVVQIPTWPGIHDAVYLYGRKVERWKPSGAERRPNPHLSSTG